MHKSWKHIHGYLRQQQSKGETHIHLDEQAKLILREFYRRAKGIKPKITKPSSQTKIATEPEPKKQTLPEAITPKGASSAEKIQSLKNQAQESTSIRKLGTLRETLVFCDGDPDADIMLIGDAPGYHEEKQETPFAGPAGKKLDGILNAMGLSREKVYLTYIVKFRPKIENQTTNNRKPSAKEIDIFAPYIDHEINTVKPKIIITLGSLASTILLNTDKSIDQLRGASYKIANTPARVTYHPSYLLSNDSNSDKRKLWEDMLDVMSDIDMPISEKQQNFFKTP